jgi:nicotinate-nucleotide pyrophosphorylase (carboxylating)
MEANYVCPACSAVKANGSSSWLQEDVPGFDFGGFVVGEKPETATLYGKSSGVLAGVPFFDEIFKQLDCAVVWHLREGDAFEAADTKAGKVAVATVSGSSRHLLLGERVALNLLARCSGIATKSRRMLKLVRQAGYQGILAGTRKTTPGFRLVEKYGMLVGGIDPHRHDLSSMVMLKDNHVWSKGSITKAVEAARAVAGFSVKIEVECRSVEEANEAITAGADIIMLDNFTGEGLILAAETLRRDWQGKASFLLECSGGLTEENVSGFLCNAIDVYSTSSVHQSVQHVDFSLKIDQK